MERKPKNKKKPKSQIMTDLTSKNVSDDGDIVKKSEPTNYKFVAVGLAVVGVLALSQYRPKPDTPKPKPKPESTIFRKMV